MNSLDNDEAPLEFYVASSSEYIDLGMTRLRLKFKIVTDANETQAPESSCTVINNILHSLWSHCHIELNGNCITQKVI